MPRQVSMQFGKSGDVGKTSGSANNDDIIIAVVNPASLVATAKVTSFEELNLVRHGNIVTISGNVKMASSASGTYTDHVAFTGAPPALVTGGTQMMAGIAIWDGGSNNSAVKVDENGDVIFRSRYNTINGKQGVFFVTYIAA